MQRQVLTRYGDHRISDGRRVPAWLIVNGADATAEATLGLSAYVQAAPGDAQARRALRQLLDGVAEMGTEPLGLALRGDPALGGVPVACGTPGPRR